MKLSRTPTLIGIAALAVVMLSLHLAAYAFFFYWSVWWYDLMMHGVGGFLIGSLAAWAVAFPLRNIVRISPMLFIGIVTLFGGLMWEVFEYVVGFQNYFSSTRVYTIDTVSDIAMDLLGALLAFYIFRKALHG